jgi:hypothetical protein
MNPASGLSSRSPMVESSSLPGVATPRSSQLGRGSFVGRFRKAARDFQAVS